MNSGIYGDNDGGVWEMQNRCRVAPKDLSGLSQYFLKC